jgi:DNA replication protein DnaC
MNPADDQLQTHLTQLKLAYVQEHYQSLADQAAQQHWTPVDYLSRLMEGEALRQIDRTVRRRMVAARFPVLKTLEQFNWNWPKKINRLQVQNLFRLAFLENHANVIFMGGVGLGKTHLAVALGLRCLPATTHGALCDRSRGGQHTPGGPSHPQPARRPQTVSPPPAFDPGRTGISAD